MDWQAKSFSARFLTCNLVAATLLLGSFALAAQAAAPVVEALQRPAVAVSAPQNAFLIDITAAGQQLVAVGERGLILRSADFGQTWQQSQVPVSTSLNAVHFADAKRGMAVGHGGVVLGTQDAGASWQLLLDGRQVAELALASAQAQGDTRAATEAQHLIAEGPDKPFLAVKMFSPHKALVVGAYGLAFTTTDAGASWQPIMHRLDNPDLLHLYAIAQQEERILLVGEQGLLNLSEDGGASFQHLNSPYAGSFFTAQLESDASMLIAGLQGRVYRSADAGLSWQQLANPVAASITASAQLPNGALVLASQAGLLLRADSSAVIPLSADRSPPINAFMPTPDGMLLLTFDGIRHSDLSR